MENEIWTAIVIFKYELMFYVTSYNHRNLVAFLNAVISFYAVYCTFSENLS